MPAIRNIKNRPTPADLAWFRSLDARSKSEVFPFPMSERHHPCVRAGIEQCYTCNKFGHSRMNGKPCTSRVKAGGALFKDWRRTVNGLSYSKDKLNMKPEDLARASLADANPGSSFTISTISGLPHYNPRPSDADLSSARPAFGLFGLGTTNDPQVVGRSV
ncbi:uncharacterized protein MELLADRAFT_118622 [Melampsora larici-populina 98AG31]|uniref:Uncharacterized protein n=1 Tax=Melampsora larici-populina (strain 98AG31 / pathotype 3-4-7) TaxID=747676 RepID=F4SBE3_MELLP|nr:uncharacterized protein MELLADRAFT_118622 [Melampsora larici-populina 98AG31]EGF98013.1 hypothetical protein MELLADRAFT_118622 [Melampsora larici-populina 98AG31]